jgi:thiamine biosynthesis lipoprotein
MPSHCPAVERRRPLLGTTVAVRVAGLADADAHAAIDDAFTEIAAIHALMSFHEPFSDVSCLNREAHKRAVTVDPRTAAVLAHAETLSAASGGTFDITIAPCLVERDALPRPLQAPRPDSGARWHDILIDGETVRFARPLWIDLGGIAKGYAVDRALAILTKAGAVQASVNAGGDLKLFGPEPETVALAAGDPRHCPVVLLADGAIASSCGAMAGRCGLDGEVHIAPERSFGAQPRRFVSVLADRCIDADGLTKVVMALGDNARPVLAAWNAKAIVHETAAGWREIAGAA